MGKGSTFHRHLTSTFGLTDINTKIKLNNGKMMKRKIKLTDAQEFSRFLIKVLIDSLRGSDKCISLGRPVLLYILSGLKNKNLTQPQSQKLQI